VWATTHLCRGGVVVDAFQQRHFLKHFQRHAVSELLGIERRSATLALGSKPAPQACSVL
jgi:hypothetical protein